MDHPIGKTVDGMVAILKMVYGIMEYLKRKILYQDLVLKHTIVEPPIGCQVNG